MFLITMVLNFELLKKTFFNFSLFLIVLFVFNSSVLMVFKLNTNYNYSNKFKRSFTPLNSYTFTNFYYFPIVSRVIENSIININNKSEVEIKCMVDFIKTNRHLYKTRLFIYDFNENNEVEFEKKIDEISFYEILNKIRKNQKNEMIVKVSALGKIIISKNENPTQKMLYFNDLLKQ